MVLQLLVMSATLVQRPLESECLHPTHSPVRRMSYFTLHKCRYISYPENHLERLSVLGTGLLLGAALGVIIT